MAIASAEPATAVTDDAPSATARLRSAGSNPGPPHALLAVALPLSCLAITLAAGVLLAQKNALRDWALVVLPMQRLQPLHTLAAIGLVLAGIASLLWLTTERLETRPSSGSGRALILSTAAALLIAAWTVVVGGGSGREYFSWAPAATPPLLLVLVALAVFFFRRFRIFSSASPEAAWLIGLGLLCMPLGLVEGHLYLLDAVPLDKSLSFEWHALDIFFAGWNATLYGFGILFAGGGAKPLRARWLFVLAAFTFVSTFGHHHYLSSQPRSLKLIAVTASMLAGVSFLRHVRVVWRERGAESSAPVAPFLRAAETWTLVAIGSGVVLAIPRVNLLLHGTWAIVAHSMVAMIGVNVMLVLGGLVHHLDFDRAEARRLRTSIVWCNRLLGLIWLDLLAAGVTEGSLRFGFSHELVKSAAANLLVPLPTLGVFLAVALGDAGRILLRASRRASSSAPASSPVPSLPWMNAPPALRSRVAAPATRRRATVAAKAKEAPAESGSAP